MSTITIGFLAILLMMVIMSVMAIEGMRRNIPAWILTGAGCVLLLGGTGSWWLGSLELPTEAHSLSWLIAPLRALPDVVWIGEAIMGLILLAVALVLALLKIFRQGE